MLMKVFHCYVAFREDTYILTRIKNISESQWELDTVESLA